MSLSADWSRSTVAVRCDPSGQNQLVNPNAMSTTNATAKAYAAVGNPIIVRTRASMLEADAAAGGGAGGSGNNNANNGGGGGALSRTLGFLAGAAGGGGGGDISSTYWIPGESHSSGGAGEMGLLETLHRRGASNKTHVLLQTRPLEELRRNFSTVSGNNIDLSHSAFRLSKTATALQNMDYSLSPRGGGATPVNNNNNNNNGGYSEYVVEELDEYGRTVRRTVAVNNNNNGNDDDYYQGGGSASRHRRHHSKHRHSSRNGSAPGSARNNANVSSNYGNNNSNNTISMSAEDFKQTLRSSLQTLQQEDYYLVRYRDYSNWAVTTYRSLARSDSYLFGRRYVEQCFAVHVGREPGELIPITETQFIFGAEILQRQLLNQLDYVAGLNNNNNGSGGGPFGGNINDANYSQYRVDLDYCCLSQDQFRSLGIVLESRGGGEGGMREVLVEAEEQKAREAHLKEQEELKRARAAGGGASYYDPYYVAPAWWDWSPGAVRRRVQHQAAYYYHSLGRLVVQAAVVGVCGWYLYTCVRGYLPAGDNSSNNSNNSNNNERGGRRGPRGGGGRRSSGGGGGWFSSRGDDYYDNDYYDDGGYRPRTLFRSVLLGPKEVFDYFLAPLAEEAVAGGGAGNGSRR